jgi:hypothetical protein
VAHACNPSYSGGRDQENQVSKPAWANSLRDPISKKTHHNKRAGGVAQGVDLEFKPQYRGGGKGDGRMIHLNLTTFLLDWMAFYVHFKDEETEA